MAFTKIAAAGIGSTELVTLHSLEVLNNATVGGVLTYEDVTNVDSVGLITARNGIVVGSGITLSKDGDGFFTGIVTATSFSGSGANLTGIDTDLVSDTSPQLGGDLASNGNDINVAANDRVVFGTDKLRVKHTDSNADIENTTGNIVIKNDSSSTSEQIILQAKGGEDSIKAIADGAVELYHDNSKKVETNSSGVTVTGTITADGLVLSDSDELQFGNSTDFRIYHDGSNSYIKDVGTGVLVVNSNQMHFNNAANDENMIKATENGAVELYHDNTKQCETSANGLAFPSGKGLDFSATSDGINASSSSSELFDDYEEGTWTPTASNFTIATQYSANYTKIGNVVYVQAYLQAATGSGTGAVAITALPFTVKGSNYYSYAACRIGGTNAQHNMVFQFNASSTNVTPYVYEGNINEGMISGQHLIFSGFYHV